MFCEDMTCRTHLQTARAWNKWEGARLSHKQGMLFGHPKQVKNQHWTATTLIQVCREVVLRGCSLWLRVFILANGR
jgi:hypothetical protein